jgi:hypothetical protein
MPANPAARQSKIMQVAFLDWQRVPHQIILKELRLSHPHLNTIRQDPLYHQTVEELKAEFKEKLLSAPGTNELVKTLGYAMGIATKKLVHILASSRTSNKDLISAARLVAQMDGRFLGSAVEDESNLSRHDAEEVATEIKGMIERHKQSVQ